MTVLAPKQPFESKESVITVDPLPVGAHVIRLVVVDDDGNSSDPFDATIQVLEKGIVVPIDITPPKQITTVPLPGDPVTTIPINPIDVVKATASVQPIAPAETLKAAPAKTTKTVKTTKPPAPAKPTNTKPGDQK